MRLQIASSKMPSLLIYSLFFFLLQSGFTQRSVILAQREPSYETLNQDEMIKVVANPRSPLLGSDVTLSCTISRLPDTVSLHWKPVGLSQQNRRNTDQIRLNNTIYMMLQQVTVEDGKSYQCEVRENGNIVLKKQAHFTVETHHKRYTLYRSVTDHSEFHLMCYSNKVNNIVSWTWLSRIHQDPKKTIATACIFQPISVSESHFVNRLMLTETPFNGRNFRIRVFPVVFEDAGDYTCILGTSQFTTIKLITVKVTAEPSDTVTDGDNVTLSCSVSDVTATTRLVWINGDGETVGDKTLKGKEKSLSLIIQKADRGRGKWTCVVFDQEMFRLSVPYNPEVRDNYTNNIAIIGSLVLLLIIILGVVLCLKKCKRKDQTPETETSHVAEYLSVDMESKQEDTEETIHYGDIHFKNKSSELGTNNRKASKADQALQFDIEYDKGSRHDMQGSNKSSINVDDSKGGEHNVIYAEIAQVAYE